MKKFIIPFLTIMMIGQVNAQVAHWIIPPYYDSIYFASEANLVITDSLNETIVWTSEGKRLFETSDELHPFAEGIAVTTEKDSDIITGFYSSDGKFTKLENCSVAHNYPYFSDGYLVVKRGDRYDFADTDGQLITKEGVAFSYPFHHGYASYRDYKNRKKPKDNDTYNCLIDRNKQILRFTYNDKDVPPSDIEFISSVNDEGIGIIVVKHKVYKFNGEKELQPVFARQGETDLKNQAKVDGKISDFMTDSDNSDHFLYMNCGKVDQISCRFDARMVPLEIGTNLNRIPFKTDNKAKEECTSSLIKTEKEGRWGIKIGVKKVLPEQFDAIYDCFGYDAFVKLSGKLGLLHIMEDGNFVLTINEGKSIGFKHQTYTTSIRLDMPSTIPTISTYITTTDTGCSIDYGSILHTETSRLNRIEYSCTLSIPDNLTDEYNEYSYPMQIVSEGIKYPIRSMKFKAWHSKYFNIDIVNHELKTGKDGASVEFIVEIKLDNSSEGDYFKKINIITDSLLYPESEKLTDTRYRCTVYDLVEGINYITIEIIEDGCPPIVSYWKFKYTKPSAKNKHKGEIEIKKTNEEGIEEESTNQPVFEPITRPQSLTP